MVEIIQTSYFLRIFYLVEIHEKMFARKISSIPFERITSAVDMSKMCDIT